jgi:hypothetical protein
VYNWLEMMKAKQALDDSRPTQDEEMKALEDSQPSKRQKILMALASALQTYGSKNPSDTSAQLITSWAADKSAYNKRKAAIIENHKKEQREDKLIGEQRKFETEQAQAGRDFTSGQADADRTFRSGQADKERDYTTTRDKTLNQNVIERDKAQNDFEMGKLQRQFDQQLKINTANHEQEIKRLQVASGLSKQEAAFRVGLESASKREQYLTEQLGLDPVTAKKYNTAVETGKWDDSTREVGKHVLEVQKHAIDLEEAQNRIKTITAVKGLTAPVNDEHGGIALDKNDKPMEAPVSFEDALAGRTPKYVRKGAHNGRGGRIDREDAPEPQQVQNPPGQKNDPKGAALQQGLDALIQKHGLKAVLDDVAQDPGLDKNTRATALAYIRTKMKTQR